MLDELNLRRQARNNSAKVEQNAVLRGANDSWLVSAEPNLKSNRFLILAMTSEAQYGQSNATQDIKGGNCKKFL